VAKFGLPCIVYGAAERKLVDVERPGRIPKAQNRMCCDGDARGEGSAARSDMIESERADTNRGVGRER